MSSSFFLKGKSKPATTKRKFSQAPRKSTKSAAAAAAAAAEKLPKHDPNEEIDSDDEAASDHSGDDAADNYRDDDDDHETAQDKRLKLAKTYLSEIEREERERADDKQLHRLVSTRLADDYLDSVGKLRKNVADKLATDNAAVSVLRHKLHKCPMTCVCVAADASFMFTASKNAFIVKWSLDGANTRAIGSFDCGKASTEAADAVVANAKKPSDRRKPARPHVIALAMSTDAKFLAVADSSNLVHIWCPHSLNHLHTFNGHRERVTALVFRRDTYTLFTASADRSVKVWSLDEMAYIETLFGHQAAITSIDALSRERAITAGGYDRTIRIWKIAEESQLIYGGDIGGGGVGNKDGGAQLVELVRLINEENFVSVGADGTLAVWSVMKKKPLCRVELAHGRAVGEGGNGEPNCISALAVVVNSDVIATGSCDGSIKLWKLGDHYRTLTLLMEVPCVGFVNALSFTSDASCLVVASGQEHRLGRWWRIKEAKNSVTVVTLARSNTLG